MKSVLHLDPYSSLKFKLKQQWTGLIPFFIKIDGKMTLFSVYLDETPQN